MSDLAQLTAQWITRTHAAEFLGITRQAVIVAAATNAWRSSSIGGIVIYYRPDVDDYYIRRQITKLARTLGYTSPRLLPLTSATKCPECNALAVRYAGEYVCQAGHVIKEE